MEWIIFSASILNLFLALFVWLRNPKNVLNNILFNILGLNYFKKIFKKIKIAVDFPQIPMTDTRVNLILHNREAAVRPPSGEDSSSQNQWAALRRPFKWLQKSRLVL